MGTVLDHVVPVRWRDAAVAGSRIRCRRAGLLTGRLERAAAIGVLSSRLLEQLTPADDNADLARPGGPRVVDEIEAVPIWRYVVLRLPVPRSDERHVQRDGRTERQLSSWLAFHRAATKTALTIDVEKFASVSAPDGLAAAPVGNHETPGEARHRVDGNVRSTGLLGDIAACVCAPRRLQRAASSGRSSQRSERGSTNAPRASRADGRTRPAQGPSVATRPPSARPRAAGEPSPPAVIETFTLSHKGELPNGSGAASSIVRICYASIGF